MRRTMVSRHRPWARRRRGNVSARRDCAARPAIPPFRDGDRLQARLKDPAPAFRTAILEGRYGPRPICAVHDGTRWRLRHPGFPGASAPAVDGLTPARFARVANGRRAALSAPMTGALATPPGGAEEREGWHAIESMLRSLREWVIGRSTIGTADRVMTQWNLEMLRGLGEPDEVAALHAAPGATPGVTDRPAAPSLQFISRRLRKPSSWTTQVGMISSGEP